MQVRDGEIDVMVGKVRPRLTSASASRTRDRSFELLYSAAFPTVRRAVFAFCGHWEIAQDAAQESFVKAYARWRRLHDEPWIEGWLVTTAMNEARRGLKRRPLSQEHIEERSVDPSNTDGLDVAAAMAKLPTRERQVAVLYFVLELPQMVIAELLDVSHGTVKAHVSHAREKLQAALNQ